MSPEKGPFFQKEMSSSKHQFSGARLVFRGVYVKIAQVEENLRIDWCSLCNLHYRSLSLDSIWNDWEGNEKSCIYIWNTKYKHPFQTSKSSSCYHVSRQKVFNNLRCKTIWSVSQYQLIGEEYILGGSRTTTQRVEDQDPRGHLLKLCMILVVDVIGLIHDNN